MRIPSGVADQVIYFVAVDPTDKTTRETGLTTFTVYRSRNTSTATVMTTPTVTEVDATNMPGVYSLLLDEDMNIGAGNDSEEMAFHITQAAMEPVTRTIELYRSKITAGDTLATTSGAVDTVTTNTDMVGTDNAALATALVTAQNDLDTLTGTDGATLATTQPNYAPNIVVPDAAGVAPTAIENRQEMDSNSTQLSAIFTDTNSLDGTKIPDTISLQNLNIYRNNAIWIDTVNGSTGTTAWINGTENNPVDNIANALTIAVARGIKNFMIANGSSITLAATVNNYNFIGIGNGVSWTLALGGQSISGCNITGANISGIGSGLATAHFDNCDFGACTLPPSEIKNSGLEGAIVVGSAGDFFFVDCYAEEGGATPSIDFGGAIVNSQINMMRQAGPLEIRNLGQAGTDVLTVEGSGHITLASTCVGGTVNLRGNFQTTDNVGGGFSGTLNENANFNVDQAVGSVTGNVGGLAGTVNDFDTLQTNLRGSLGASIDMTKISQKNTAGAYDPDTDSLEAIRDRGDASWITGGGGGITDILEPVPLIPLSIDLADTASFRLGIMLTNQVDDLPSVVEITPGTISIERKAIGGTSWIAIVTDVACSESPGLIYYDEVFDSGTGYTEGDSIRVTLKSQKITVAANDYEITDSTGRFFYTEIRQTMRGTNSSLTDKNNFNLSADQSSVTIGTVSVLTGHTPQTGDSFNRLGAPSGASVSADNAAIKSDSAAIKLKTDNLPENIKKNTALNNFKFFMVLTTDHVTGATGLTITSKVQRDGGSFGATTNSAIEVGGGWYRINLTAVDLNADSVALEFSAPTADTRAVSIPSLAL